MQIRCYNCHMPFALNRETIHAALDAVAAENLSHFNAHCPRCRKANRIPRQRLQRAAPDWVPAADRPSEEEAEAEAEAKTE